GVATVDLAGGRGVHIGAGLGFLALSRALEREREGTHRVAMGRVRAFQAGCKKRWITSMTPLGVGKHVVAPKAQDPVALLLEPRGASGIVLRLDRMLAAVDLDDQQSILGKKIGDVGADGHLATEFHTVELTVAKGLPELVLRVRRLPAEFVGALLGENVP